MAAALSALWPGLGQWYAGRPRSALAHGLPPLLAVLGVALFFVAQRAERAFALLLQPQVSLTVLAIVIVLLVWRLFSMARARSSADRGANRSQRRVGWAVFALAAALVIVLHGYAASFPWAFYQTSVAVFRPDPTPGIGIGATPSPAIPTPTGTPGPTREPGASFPAEPSPTASPATTAPPSGRINVLFIGIDALPIRNKDHRLTDTILIASFDPSVGKVDMVSLPRDVARFPLFDRPDVEFEGKINELVFWADEHPDIYPQGGIATLVSEVEYLVGIEIDYYASVEIPGFREMIDAVGGVDIVNQQLIDDPEYDWEDGRIGYRLEPGPYHLDGSAALPYVRSRKGVGNTDFQRARRQQQVLLALRQKLDDPDVLARLPDILAVAARNVRSNLPTDDLPMVMDMARQSEGAKIKSVVLGPTTFASLIPASDIGGLYALKLDLKAVAAFSVRLWGSDSRYWDPSNPPPSEEPGTSPGGEPAETELPAP